jgi:hypothetical protein
MAVLTQLVVLMAPIAEGHTERQLGAHVEGPRTAQHPGQHNPDSCPACQILSLHARTAERPEMPEMALEAGFRAHRSAARASGATLPPSNSSRAPPVASVIR